MKIARVYIGEFPSVTITGCTIKQNVNEHAYASITGIIEEDIIDACMNKGKSESYLTIKAVDEENGHKDIFKGLVYSMKIENDGAVNTLELVLVTGTIKLDGNNYTKTFQNSGTTYSKLFKNLEKSEAASSIMYADDKGIGKMVVQYNETNWEFAQRIASNMGTCIYPEVSFASPRYYIGVGKGSKSAEITTSSVRIKQSVEKYMLDNNKESIEKIKDCVAYEVESRDYAPIGSKVSIPSASETLYIYSVNTSLIRGEIINKYVLKSKGGFDRVRKYNHKLIGASLGGKITGVSGSTVKISVDEDGKNGNGDCGSKDFAYSTVYSSPDGTGWYCMPEEGDRIRVYFPTEKEEDGYVISSVHLDVDSSASNSSARSNPDEKSISNKQNKQIIFAPTYIEITNNEMGSAIKLDDENGITITTDKSIYFKADKGIEFNSANDIYLTANKQINMEQSDQNSILLDEKAITIKGPKVKMQDKE